MRSLAEKGYWLLRRSSDVFWANEQIRRRALGAVLDECRAILETGVNFFLPLLPSALLGNAVKHIRTAGDCPTVRSFGVLNSRRPILQLWIRGAAPGGGGGELFIF